LGRCQKVRTLKQTEYSSFFSSTFWLDPKSSQKDQDFEFDSLCRSFSEGSSFTSSKGFSADFVTRCLAHELSAMLSIRVWQCSLKNIEFYVGPNSILNFSLRRKNIIPLQNCHPRAWKDVTGTLTTKLRQNFWLSEPRNEASFRNFSNKEDEGRCIF
jgi:hypothetical protein